MHNHVPMILQFHSLLLHDIIFRILVMYILSFLPFQEKYMLEFDQLHQLLMVDFHNLLASYEEFFQLFEPFLLLVLKVPLYLMLEYLILQLPFHMMQIIDLWIQTFLILLLSCLQYKILYHQRIFLATSPLIFVIEQFFHLK